MSQLMPQMPMMVIGITQDGQNVALQPVGPAKTQMIRAAITELKFLSHSTQRLVDAVFHLRGSLQGTTDEESVRFITMLLDILDPDGSLRRVVEEELLKQQAPAAEPGLVTQA